MRVNFKNLQPEQVGLLLNALQFAYVALGHHEATEANNAQTETLVMAMDAMESFPKVLFDSLLISLKRCVVDMQDKGITNFTQRELGNDSGPQGFNDGAIAAADELDKVLRELNKLEGYQPGTGPFNAKPRFDPDLN